MFDSASWMSSMSFAMRNLEPQKLPKASRQSELLTLVRVDFKLVLMQLQTSRMLTSGTRTS